MYSASTCAGLRIQIDGVPYYIGIQFCQTRQGAAIYNCKLKNLINGSTLTKSYRSNDKFEEPQIEDRKMRYSYNDGTNYVLLTPISSNWKFHPTCSAIRATF